MKGNLTKITNILLNIMFIGGIVTVLTLPLSLKLYAKYMGYELEKYYLLMIILFAICGAFALTIVWDLKKIFRTVMNDDCFVRENVTSLNRMGIYSFGIALVMIAKNIVNLTLAGVAMVLVFVIAGLFSRVLAQVFDCAVTYKQENDLTI